MTLQWYILRSQPNQEGAVWREAIVRGVEFFTLRCGYSPKTPGRVRYDRISQATCSSNWTCTRASIRLSSVFGLPLLCLRSSVSRPPSFPHLSLLHLAADRLIQVICRWRLSSWWLSLSKPCRDMPSAQIEQKKQHSWLLRASRRANRFVVVITGCLFRYSCAM